MRAKFRHFEWENPSKTIASFTFEPATSYRYEAGQYAIITLPHDDTDSRGDSRTMTLSSSPEDDDIKFTMRLIGDSASSFKRALLRLQPGDDVTIFDAMGDLVLPLDSSIPLMFVAGGVGIASFVGMVKWLLQHNEKRAITLHYSVRQPEDIALQPVFDDYARQYSMTKVLYTSAFNTAPAFRGKVVAARLDAGHVLPFVQPGSLLYLSGPEGMVDGLRSGLQAAGVSNQQIIFDYFDGYIDI